MLFSTLPDLPGQKYHPLGIVYSAFTPLETKDAQEAFAEMVKQAEALHADAVINVQVITPHDSQYHASLFMLGTAVKIEPQSVGTQ